MSSEQNDETDEPDVQVVTGILQDHAGWSVTSGRCSCGFEGVSDHPFYHRRHIAELIVAALSSPAATTREWEYGIKYLGNFTPRFEAFARQQAKDGAGSLVRRTPAGPWSPVPKGDE